MAFKHLIIPVIFLFCALSSGAQITSETKNTITLPASDKYYKSSSYKKKWGEHYRKEWHTPVRFSKVNLDTLEGGLSAYDTGGGRQTRTVRLRDKDGREYVLRSIDKNLGEALPEILRGTFIENFANDQVTFAHPYGALIIAPLAEAARIYHTNPAVYFVPSQKALNTFNDSSGNRLYLFEQRPDDDWSTAKNFGNSNKIISTEDLLKKILADSDNTIDQKAYVRARLFDMIIGDWAKHEDQWRWAGFEHGKKTLFVPIPRDRDNAFSKFDGSLLKLGKGLAGVAHLDNYGPNLPDPVTFNHSARHLDHHLLNGLTLAEWTTIAADIKNKLTDNVIDAAVKKLPPEVYPISGPTIAANIKSRRNNLEVYAKKYYLYLSDEVEITGTSKNELVEVSRLSDTETQVQISRINEKGSVKEGPYYSRIFNSAETREVRFYGINGKDEYRISGNHDKAVKVRLIGGPGNDVYEGASVGSNAGAVHIYDNKNNEIKKSGATHLHLSNDSSIHAYKYDFFKRDKRGFSPKVFYSNEDRIYVGLGYKIQNQKWRKEPFGVQHSIDVKYSFAQNGLSSTYESIFTSLIGKWDLNLYANYDQMKWTNYYGLGNETLLTTKERDFNRVRSQQFLGKIGVQRVYNNRQRITINPFFQSYDVINDTARYLAKQDPPSSNETYKAKLYGGVEIEYLYQNVNDSVLPTKGFNFLTLLNYSQNLEESDHIVAKFGGQVNFFVPLSKKFGLSLKAGGATLTGSPEFYQYLKVGGSEDLRGHQRDRFYGSSSAYNQNELRWISDVRSHLYNGKIGFFGFYDLGRVWLEGEDSNTWHSGYGIGLLLVPFNKIAVTVGYGVSSEDTNIHVRLKKAL